MAADFFVRQALARDLDAVLEIQMVAHPTFQEEEAVFAERLALYPQGFLVATQDDAVCGYAISHPWPRGSVPALNAMLGAIPDNAGAYYIHDVSLLPTVRGLGASGLLIAALKAQAIQDAFPVMALTAVGGSCVFWERHGFAAVPDPGLVSALSTYGADAVSMEALL